MSRNTLNAKLTSRLGVFAYGAVCYGLFLATFLYAVGFVEGLTPTSLTVGLFDSPLAEAVAINVGLLGLFAVQHLIMARRWFKRIWTRIIPPAAERSTFVLATCLVFLALFTLWRPIPVVVWEIESMAGKMTLWTLSALGYLVVLLATYMIDHFDLFGLRQVTLYLRKKPYTKPRFKEWVFYKHVRHPLMLGFLVAFWSTPVMTVGQLLFAGGVTGFVLIALQFEERDLVTEHGEDYRKYQQRVPMLVPFLRLGINAVVETDTRLVMDA